MKSQNVGSADPTYDLGSRHPTCPLTDDGGLARQRKAYSNGVWGTSVRAIAIVNPISGRRNVSAIVQAVARELDSAGCELQVTPTRNAGDARRIAAEVPDDTHAILAVGGDGTICEIAAGLEGRNIPVGVVPAGTENIVARHFHMPSDPVSIAEMVLHGETLSHDVGMLNGRAFIIVCGIGFDACVVERLAAARSGHIGHHTYVGPLWQSFWREEFPTLTVVADGQFLFEGRGLALVGIQPRYSLGLRILSRAVHDDGYLDVCVFPCDNKLALVGHSLRAALGRHLDHGGVVYRKCRTVRITSPCRVPVQCDGDPMGILPASIDIRPSALRLLAPPRRGG